MSTFNKCTFFYLSEVIFSLKGELPVYACDRKHEINTECNEACPDFQQIQIKSTTNLHFPQET